MTDALIVIDVQNDFCPGGALAVDGGDEIVPGINRLIRDFPELYKNFAIREFGFDGRAPANRFNRNPLLSLGIGADGLKTGHTQEAGYGLVGSAVQNGRRVVFVITGLSGETARAEEAERIVNWSFRQFTMKKLVPAGETVVEAPVWLGTQDRLGLTTRPTHRPFPSLLCLAILKPRSGPWSLPNDPGPKC